MTEPRKTNLRYTIPYAETDQMGVVYYAHYLVYFERARTALLNDLGLPYRELEKQGIALPVVEAHVEYRSPVTYDDTIDIYGWLAGRTAVRLKVGCEVRKDGVLVAEGYTVHACIDIRTRKIIRLPKALSDLWPLTAQNPREKT